MIGIIAINNPDTPFFINNRKMNWKIRSLKKIKLDLKFEITLILKTARSFKNDNIPHSIKFQQLMFRQGDAMIMMIEAII